MAFELGPIKVENGVICAPICGATKIPYRRLVRKYGADLCYTEMIKAVALVRGKERSFELAELAPDEHPTGAQICGANPDEMAEAGRILEGLGFDTIDINMGCPVPKVVREGAGAALMRDTTLVEKVVKAVVDAVKIPVTIKIRSGWTQDALNALEVSTVAQGAGAQMVSIHGRARSQRHSGEIDYGTIAEIKSKLSVPVIGNGGIFEPHLALKMIKETGCDGVMIGRGGYGRPWFFRDCALAMKGLEPGPYPDTTELRLIMLDHFEGTLQILGEQKGVRSFRKCCAWYFKDLPYGTYFRDLAFRARTPEEIRQIIEAWILHMDVCKEAAKDESYVEVPPILKDFTKGGVPPWMFRASRLAERERLQSVCEEAKPE
jgi:tRNA-dihydrouridine synthase B